MTSRNSSKPASAPQSSAPSNEGGNAKLPHNVYVVNEMTDRDGYIINDDKTGEPRKRWREVGIAFPHADGKGFNITIDPGIQIGGNKIVVRERKPADNNGE